MWFGAYLRLLNRTDVIVRLSLAFVVVAGAIAITGDALVTVAAFAAVLAADPRNLLSLKNFFLCYVLLIFGVGGHHFAPDDRVISFDLLVYVLLFLAAYAGGNTFSRRRSVAARSTSPRNGRAASLLVVASIVGWTVLLATQLYAYGVAGFYSGQGLADRIARYGHADLMAGLLAVFEQGLSILTIACAVVYVEARTSAGKRPSYLLLSLPLIVAPLLLLRRADFAIGLLLLLVVQPIACRLTGARYSVLGSIPLVLGSAAFALAFSVTVGSLRESALVAPPTPAPVESPNSGVSASPSPGTGELARPKPVELPVFTEQRTFNILVSELSPVLGYRDVREHPADFTYQLGRTIVLPLAAKLAPRNWFPDKPISSSAYYNLIRSPAAFAAGYTLPVTSFGDALINFGYAGALTFSLLLGLIAAKLDRTMVGASADIATLLIVYYYFYSLLRNDLANSLAMIFLAGAAYLVLRATIERLSRSGPPHVVEARK
jgi:hypothetical protein